MQITYQSLRLDTCDDDEEALLVFRDGRLLAVASRLCAEHGDLAGSVFIEAMFGAHDRYVGATFRSQEELAQWAINLDAVQSEKLTA